MATRKTDTFFRGILGRTSENIKVSSIAQDKINVTEKSNYLVENLRGHLLDH